MMATAEPEHESITKQQNNKQHTRPSLTRTLGTSELLKPYHSPDDWNKRRTSLKKQSRSKEFDDGKCLTKSWQNDDLSDLKMKRQSKETLELDDTIMLSHIYTLQESVGSVDSGISGCSAIISETQAEF
jgi:hypothetical protein